jgi:glycine/D-amino acid oxidase-like deaminating enzyme
MIRPNINTFAPTHTVEPVFSPLPCFDKTQSVCVIGAGAFGGWSALHLLRKGYKVILVDAWGAANSRSSSSDETRVIRSTYGGNELYFQLNVRALQLWKENEKRFNQKVFFNTGVIWFCYEESNPIIDQSIPFSKKYKMEYEKLEPSEIKKRFPVVNTEDLKHAFHDPFGGYLKAREGTQAVLESFIKEGGIFIKEQAKPGSIIKGKLQEIVLSSGKVIQNDAFIFACGSWLSSLFPALLNKQLNCTKQEGYYFGVPAASSALFDCLPAWIDLDGKDFYYGIAGNSSRGFKIGVDKRGVEFDPTNDDRTLDKSVLADARNFLSHRFPALKNAPLLENRVCPYENSNTGNFIFDKLPDTENAFVLGGGSGHGFKHGPALGELVAACISGEKSVPDLFRLR